jgi:hypothetical protein
LPAGLYRVVDFINTPWMVQAISQRRRIFIVSMIGVALLGTGGSEHERRVAS